MDEEKDAFDDDFPAVDPKADPFALEEDAPAPDTKEEELPQDLKNRHVRRLEKKLAQTREEAIELAARLSERSELQKFTEENQDPDIAKIYGTDTPEAREATRLLQGALSKVEKNAEDKAFARFEARQQEQVKAQRKAESFIDDQLESLEDTHNLDLTSDAPQARKARKEFLELVQKASPKDENGDIKEYADFETVFDLYSSTRVKPVTRNQDLASRSMVRSGSAQGTAQSKAVEDYLKQSGII